MIPRDSTKLVFGIRNYEGRKQVAFHLCNKPVQEEPVVKLPRKSTRTDQRQKRGRLAPSRGHVWVCLFFFFTQSSSFLSWVFEPKLRIRDKDTGWTWFYGLSPKTPAKDAVQVQGVTLVRLGS